MKNTKELINTVKELSNELEKLSENDLNTITSKEDIAELKFELDLLRDNAFIIQVKTTNKLMEVE
ncbi:hypothetical protein AB4G91_06875 [Macrococcoides goetzii]|uniref:hypothetical protein n=1 Tax=Macrococcus sp. PK TaxID=2801919 RepID=UPI001F0F50B2|nr:hypothetical protein [Macrococcus sp. PK]MCH4984910.1 hypothetical protein [Macrococcus sp. PK]